MRRNYSGGDKTNSVMLIQPNFGLDEDTRLAVVKMLNSLVADEAILTKNTSTAHWQVRGLKFLELTTLFNQQLQQLIVISDEVEERVSVLGGYPIRSYEEILAHTRLKESTTENPDTLGLLADHEAFIRLIREDTRKCLEEYEDQGTFAMLISILRIHEKMAWKLRTYIEPTLTGKTMGGKNDRPPDAKTTTVSGTSSPIGGRQ